MKKTFKIGEYAKGGVITAEVSDKRVAIIGKDWDFSQGSNRNSNQSNAKEFTRIQVDISDSEAYNKCYDFLLDLTTPYYSEQVLNWVKEQSSEFKERW